MSPTRKAPKFPTCWLMKSEPDVFSFDDLLKAPNQTTFWDGVRNYEARNMMRDLMHVGDHVLYYHSNAEPSGIAGIAEIVREAYPDQTAFDKNDPHYDPKSKPDAPTWFMVDVRAIAPLPRLITLQELRDADDLSEMALFRRSRLSVQPVTAAEYRKILKMIGWKTPPSRTTN